jgi:hypothetical protein
LKKGEKIMIKMIFFYVLVLTSQVFAEDTEKSTNTDSSLRSELSKNCSSDESLSYDSSSNKFVCKKPDNSKVDALKEEVSHKVNETSYIQDKQHSQQVIDQIIKDLNLKLSKTDLAISCESSQTIAYDLLLGVFMCRDIKISKTQVIGLEQSLLEKLDLTLFNEIKRDLELSISNKATLLGLKKVEDDVIMIFSKITELTSALAQKVDISSLHSVATSGNYNDLINKPNLTKVYGQLVFSKGKLVIDSVASGIILGTNQAKVVMDGDYLFSGKLVEGVNLRINNVKVAESFLKRGSFILPIKSTDVITFSYVSKEKEQKESKEEPSEGGSESLMFINKLN